eukprot:CAMPEP_0119517586 /NCGR_PEP_ID=MMETSP1344-20130328/34429_1 /TAXON_ID=236787 /ORGANISM="Florenciella parvula, Strain CCMP2471" /LENGTH=57 /DNA_ID=CAMNT_0007555185 /DNA_START=152 /DNA_END=321 /DNA_ORIENTATION=+
MASLDHKTYSCADRQAGCIRETHVTPPFLPTGAQSAFDTLADTAAIADPDAAAVAAA